MPRPSIGDIAMTGAERIRRWRERHGKAASNETKRNETPAGNETHNTRNETIEALRARVAELETALAEQAQTAPQPLPQAAPFTAKEFTALLFAVHEDQSTVETRREALELLQARKDVLVSSPGSGMAPRPADRSDFFADLARGAAKVHAQRSAAARKGAATRAAKQAAPEAPEPVETAAPLDSAAEEALLRSMPYYGDLRKLLDEVRESGTAGLSGGETEHHRAGWRGTGWRGTGASVKTLLQRLKAKGLIVATKERRGFKGFGDVVYVAPEFARL